MCIAATLLGLPGRASASTASWKIVPSPSPSPPGYTLTDVTCRGAGNCWAVGYNGNVHGSQTLIEHNTGSGWVIFPSPTPANNWASILTGVTCVSVSDCWTVGYQALNYPAYTVTLIEHYDGTSWTIVSSPNPGSLSNYLEAVKCVNASNCWAVGVSYTPNGTSNGQQTMIEQYQGGIWVVAPGPLANAYLTDVACLSLLGDCWAVGASSYNAPYGPCPPTSTTGCSLIEHNTGSGWAVFPSPNVVGSALVLNGVTCVSASNCWAVGSRDNSTLAEHYDGSAWTIVPSPNFGANRHYNSLADVSCASANDCWAVGRRCCLRSGGVSYEQTLIEHNAGGGWDIVDSPNEPNQPNSLRGVKCVSALNCWAVGGSGSIYPTVVDTLIEHYG
jgi:hypothetical protein